MSNIIKSLSFNILTREEILKKSVVEINIPESYDAKGVPVPNGISDLRLGSIRYHEFCKTCNKDIIECNGHFGHIMLKKPVFNIMVLKGVADVLNSICTNCGIKKDKEYGLITDGEVQIKKIIKCRGCKEELNYHYKVRKPYFINKVDSKNEVIIQQLNAFEVKEIFNKMSSELKSSISPYYNVDDLLLEALLVLPLKNRPSIILESGLISENDLSFKLVDIIRANKKLQENNITSINEYYYDALQYHIASYMDNQLPDLPTSQHLGSKRDLVGIIQRLKGKEGRIRANVISKRVDFCARTTISSNPHIGINETSIPRKICDQLTIPETITSINYDKYLDFIKELNPVIKTFKKKGGFKIKLTENTLQECLDNYSEGVIIERSLMENDYVLINRPPTLHKHSFLAHKVVISDDDTIGIHPQICHPYNADFDGDEMTLHLPQTYAAMIEASELCSLKNNLLEEKSTNLAYGLVEDSLLGLFMLTDDLEKTYSLFEFSNLMKGLDFNLIEIEKKITATSILSLIFPKDLNFEATNKLNIKTIIKDGKLIQGSLDKKLVGINGVLFDYLNKRYNSELVFEVLSKFVTLGKNIVNNHGVTIDADEYLLPKVVRDNQRKSKKEFLENMKILHDEIEATNDKKKKNEISKVIQKELNKFREELLNKNVSKLNKKEKMNLYYITNSGAKGTVLNFLQITTIIGQQSTSKGKIEVKEKLEKYRASQSSILEREGLVLSNYIEGLNATEYLSSAIVARESAVGASVMTKISGYAERRLIHALQELLIVKDKTIRDSSNNIIQFEHTSSSLDGTKFNKTCGINLDSYLDFEENDYSTSTVEKADIEKELLKIMHKEHILLPILIDYLYEKKISIECIERDLKTIKDLINNFSLSEGAPIGIITAQSLGEPATQMTLHSLHTAGKGNTMADQGLSRFVSLIDNSNLKNELSYVYIPKSYSKVEIKDVLKKIIPCSLSNFEHIISSEKYSITVSINNDKLNEILDVTNTIEKNGHLLQKLFLKFKISEKFNTIITKLDDNNFEFIFNNLNKSIRELVKLEKSLKTVFLLKGVKTYVDYRLDENEENYILEISGVKLKNLMQVLSKYTDFKYSSADIKSIEKLFGIEAARQTIVSHIKTIFRDQTINLDDRHFELLADAMCRTGTVLGVSRSGIVNCKESALAKLSFEKISQNLIDSVLERKVDNIKGILENIMLGQLAKIGTNVYSTKLKNDENIN